MGMKFLATEARFENGIFTGHFKTRNNNGKEKVNRIKKEIEGKKYDKIIAFGDTSGDLPMLSLAHESHYRFFINFVALNSKMEKLRFSVLMLTNIS
jgi:phosphoserine phosphatase